ncbi:MAG: c-type cytochrome [bacterium]|nr:c-type cytochrome [bacterium]
MTNHLLHACYWILARIVCPQRIASCKLRNVGLVIFGLTTVSLAEETDSQSFPKLEFRKWSGDINVPDPVAVSVDDFGRVYATQTRRRKIQDLDIREHSEWIPNDLSLTSVEEKRAFFHKALAIDGDQQEQSKHVQDWNEDGRHDWRDLTVVSEAIYRLVDRDQDGVADEITTFAEDFRTEVTGVAAGVLANDGKVYATIAPDVWLLRDHDDDGVADSREVIAHGFGLHIAYGGHDMHGLTVGPDGKLYWSIGDKGIHVTTPDGRVYAYPHRGGVMRCNPDGSDFEVFAHGLRNVQEVAFDQYGNLFGVDNDSDQPDEKERFVYIVDGMDAGWRNYYQYRGESYNAWTAEKLWELAGEQHPAYIVPPISHYVDGPAGFKFNPGTALSPEYRDFFFLTSAPNGQQYAFRTERTGDSFRMLDAHQIGEGLAIVGLAFGPDGALYGADWDGGYPLDQKGSVIRIDVPANAASEARGEVQELLKQDFAQSPEAQLLSLLGHADMRIRMRAQFDLVERGATQALAATAMTESADILVRLHALWGLGQLARAGDVLARDTISLLTRSSDAILRGQAVKTYGEVPEVVPEPVLPLLADPDLHVRTLAGLALARHPTDKAVSALLEQIDALEAEQHYLRHALVLALAACASSEELAEQSSSENTMRRLCSVLALRKHAHQQLTLFLDDASDWVATEAARAIHDEQSVIAALPALAEALLSRESQSEAFFRRALNANFRLGTAAAAARIIDYAQRDSVSLDRRLHALQMLSGWRNPPAVDGVEGIHRPLAEVDSRSLDKDEVAAALGRLALSETAELRNAAIAAASSLQLDFSWDTLKVLAQNSTLDVATRRTALQSLSEKWTQLLNGIADESPEELRVQAHAIQLRQQSEAGYAGLEEIIRGEASEGSKQAAIGILAEQADDVSVRILGGLGERLLAGELDAGLELDVWEALLALRAKHPDLAATIDAIASERGAEELSKISFQLASAGGNQQRGEILFRTHVEAQCSRCHRVGERGSEIGPALTEIGAKRDANYLLRSILEPSADIDEKYRSHLLLLDNDEVISGVLQQASNADETVIANASGELRVISNEEIVQMTEQKVSLMPKMTEILTAREIRDLVAYLRSLK